MLDKMIEINFSSPHLPNLELLDTPGIKGSGAGRDSTLKLLDEQIALHEKAIFLAVFPMSHDATSCSSVDIVADHGTHGLFDRSIGVITRSDRAEFGTEELGKFPERLNKLLKGKSKAGKSKAGKDLGDRFIFTTCVHRSG